MAGALGDTSMLEEELKCAVCLNFYREPHLLPCGHSFCLRCLRKLKSRSECGLRCPECRENHHPSTQWQKNFRLASIADGFRQCTRAQRHNQSRPEPSGYKTTEVCCDYCGPDIASNSGKKSTPVKTCLKCEVSMCPEHVQHHLELPAFRDHPLVEPLSDLKKRKCTEHDELFRYYCRNEHKFLCNACTIERGQSRHAIKTLKNTMKDLRVPLSSQWQDMNRKLKRVMKIEQEQKEIEFRYKSFLEEIDRRLGILRGDLMTRLDGFMLSLSENVHQFELENSLKIQHQLRQTGEARHHMEIVHARIEQMLQETDPFLFIKDYRSCAKSYRRLLKRPFFEPHTVPLHTEVTEENMAEKLEDFVIDLRQHITTFINTVFSSDAVDDDEGAEEEEGDDDDEEEEEEGEEDGSDENEEESSSSDENEEQEEDVSENEEEEEEDEDDDEYTESAYGYSPEEEEDE